MDTNVIQKVSCIVNYVYEASEPDELSIKPGDVLKEVERLPGGWWRGELRGRKGMFPDNFVTVLNDQSNTKTGGVQGRCRAVFSYQPANPDELALCVGDVLEVLGEVEEGWWQGRRQGRVGVFPSNFVVMLESEIQAPLAPAPQLPPKPVKEQCRVIFPYTAVNEDELSLTEGEIVTVLSKDAPDRGWWRGELHGKQGYFPDNFVQLLPPGPIGTPESDEKKPERPPSKTSSGPGLYPILNKYSEKTSSNKEITTTSKISSLKDNSSSKEGSIQSTVAHTNKNDAEKLVYSETISDNNSVDGQTKKPPVPVKKSPTPTSGVGGLLSGLKNKIMPSSENREKSLEKSQSGSGSSGEWDKIDGSSASKSSNTNTFDRVERNSILNDPRAGRVKAPRRRPPSQVFREDTPLQIGLSNGHETTTEKQDKPDPEKVEEIKPRAREWEKHRAPWMEELKLNQAKKGNVGDVKSRSVSASSEGGVASKAGGGSTDRILECGLEEKKSTHSTEMSKSTSSISSRISVIESFEETKTRNSLEPKKENPLEASQKPNLPSPTAAGRTLQTMLDEIKKPPAPVPPPTSTSSTNTENLDKSPIKSERLTLVSDKSQECGGSKAERLTLISDKSQECGGSKKERPNTAERITQCFTKSEEKVTTINDKGSSTLERRSHVSKIEKGDAAQALITQLNNRINNLEKLLEAQNAKFTAAVEELNTKLKLERERREALQAELEKLAQCVTQV